MCRLIQIKRKPGKRVLLTSVKTRTDGKATLGSMNRDQRLIEGVIGSLRFLRGASPAQHATLARQSWVLPLARGKGVVQRGERLPGVLALAYGTVKLSLRTNGHDERVIGLVSAGQSFGEAAALLGRPCPYEPIALADSKLVVMPSAAILALIELDARLARGMLQTLAERSLALLEELHAVAPRRGVQRLAAYLDSLAVPRDGDGAGWRANLPGTKTLVASRLGMTKETLSRLLRSLAERGVIELSRREIRIVDRGALGELGALVEVERVPLKGR